MDKLSIAALILIALGGIGGILLAIAQSNSSSRDKNEIIDKGKKQIAKLEGQLDKIESERDSLKSDLEARDFKIQKQAQDIMALSLELSEKSEHIQNFVTGGSGFPEVEVRVFGSTGNPPSTFTFYVYNNFKYPLYDLQITVIDYDKLESKLLNITNSPLRGITVADLKTSTILHHSLDVIPAGEFRMLPQTFPVNDHRFYVQMNLRNQAVVEKLVLHMHNGFSYSGYVVGDLKQKVLKQVINEEMSADLKNIVKQKIATLPGRLELNVLQ